MSFVHVLASTPPSGIGALQRLSTLKDAREIPVRNAFATALGGLAAAGVLHGIQKPPVTTPFETPLEYMEIKR